MGVAVGGQHRGCQAVKAKKHVTMQNDCVARATPKIRICSQIRSLVRTSEICRFGAEGGDTK